MNRFILAAFQSRMSLTADSRPDRMRRMTSVRPTSFLTGCTLILFLVTPIRAQQSDPALDLYYLANGAYNRKLYPAAITGYQEFLQEHGTHPKAVLARHGLALSHYAQKQYAEASPHLAALLAQGKLPAQIGRDRLAIMQGQCLLQSGKKEEAKALFVREEKNLKDARYRVSALAAICDISFGSSAWEDVLTWSAKLLAAELTPNQAARGFYQQGFAHYRLGNHVAAAASLDNVTPLAADAIWKTRASYLLGECHALSGNHEAAKSAFVVALKGLKGKDLAECHRRLGVSRFMLKNWNDAARDFEAFLGAGQTASQKPAAADEHVQEAELFLARCFLERGQFKQAGNKLTLLAKGNTPTAARANLWLARVFTRPDNPNHARAAEILASAVQRFAGSPIGNDLRFDYASSLMSGENPNWKLAASVLGQINASEFPQLAEVLAQRATCYHKLGDHQTALGIGSEFLGRFKGHALAGDMTFLRSECLFQLNNPGEAIIGYQAFISANSGHSSIPAARVRIAQIHHREGRWDQCLATAKPLLAEKLEGPLLDQLHFLVGDCHFRAERWKDAVEPLEAFVTSQLAQSGETGELAVGSNVDTALLQLAVAHDREGHPEKSLSHLATLTGLNPSPSRHLAFALAEQGRIAFEQENLELAREALERFLEEDRKNRSPFKEGAGAQRARVHYFLGWVEATEKNHEQAAKHFAEVARDPRADLAADAALQQGLAYVNAKQFDLAARHFPDLLSKYPKHDQISLATYYAGLSLARQENWPQAAVHMRKVATTWPDFEFADQALYELAWCERKQNRDKEAVKLYEQFLGKFPQRPLAAKVQSELAELNLQSGAQEMVIARLTKALQEVNDEDARENLRYQLATAHFSKGDYAQSAVMFEELLADYPRSKVRGSMYFQAGESRFRLKETIAAREHYAEGMKTEALNPALAESMMIRLAEMQSATNSFSEARETYSDFIARYPESPWRKNALFGVAWSMENSDDPEGAIQAYAKLLETKDPADLWTVRARFQTGECHFNMQEYDRAVEIFLEVEKLHKKHPAWQAKAILEIARVRVAQDKRPEAIKHFREVITRYPQQKAAIVAKQYLDQLRSR